MDPTSPNDRAGDPTPEPAPEVVAPSASPQRRKGLVIGVAIGAVVLVAAVVVALVAGGGDPSPKVSTLDRSASKSTAPTTGPPTTVSSRRLAPFSDDPTVTCSIEDPVPFPASALSGATGAERGTSPAAQQLRSDLDGPHSGYFDGNGTLKTWRLATETSSDALFLGGDGAQRYAQHYKSTNGTWRWVSGSNCASTTVVEPGLNVVALNLADDQTVDASTTKVRLLVTELACNGEAELTNDRVVGPQVHLDADRVVIGMGASKPAKVTSKSCVATQPVEVTVDLGEALGSRTLLNGNRFPYRPIS